MNCPFEGNHFEYGRKFHRLLTNVRPHFTSFQPKRDSKIAAVSRGICCLIYITAGREKAAFMGTSDSKWFTIIQPAQHGCPLSCQKRGVGGGPLSFPLYTPPPPSFHSNSIPQCTCLVHKRERKRREGIPFDLDRHANVGGHATAMEHPTAQQHRGAGSLTICASL